MPLVVPLMPAAGAGGADSVADRVGGPTRRTWPLYIWRRSAGSSGGQAPIRPGDWLLPAAASGLPLTVLSGHSERFCVLNDNIA